MFYFWNLIRYETNLISQSNNLIETITSLSIFSDENLKVLIAWHVKDMNYMNRTIFSSTRLRLCVSFVWLVLNSRKGLLAMNKSTNRTVTLS